MELLLVEDDELKLERVQCFLREEFFEFQITVARSLNSTLGELLTKSFDIVILDMSLPTFDINEDEDGGRPQGYAGREVLRQMDRNKITTPVVILTQFDNFGDGRNQLSLEQLDALLKEKHKVTYVQSVYYSSAIDGWKDSLRKIINKIVAS